MARKRPRNQGNQKDLIDKFRNMSSSEQLQIARDEKLNWENFDALINTAKPSVLRILTQRNNLSALWRHRALQSLREKGVAVSSNDWIDSIKLAIQVKNISANEKKALELQLAELYFLEFQRKLEMLSKPNVPEDTTRLKQIRLIVAIENNEFHEIFSWTHNRSALHHYSRVLNFLCVSRVEKKDFTFNSLLRSEFYEVNPNKWKIPQEAVLNWPTDVFASFLFLILTFRLNRVEYLRLFENLKDMERLLSGDLGNLYKKALLNSEKKKREDERKANEAKGREARIAHEAKVREAWIAEREQLGRQKAAEREAKERHERKIQEQCQSWQDKISLNFPWPVPFENLTIEVLERLNRIGIVHENGKLNSYQNLPIKFDSATGKILVPIDHTQRNENLLLGKRSLFESFSREFPENKKSLVETYRGFARYLDHEKRYLCQTVCFQISNESQEIVMRIDQVALNESNGVFTGCWVVSIFGVPDYIGQGIKLMRAQILGRADFLKSLMLDEDLKRKLDSVYYVKKMTSEGARTWIGLFLELLEITFDFEAKTWKLVITPLPPEIEKHRELIFKSALQRTFWQGAKSSGDGTNFCENCGREIWDAPSLARGIGPECWKKIRFTDLGRRVLSTSSHSRNYEEDRDRLAITREDWIASVNDYLKETTTEWPLTQ